MMGEEPGHSPALRVGVRQADAQEAGVSPAQLREGKKYVSIKVVINKKIIHYNYYIYILLNKVKPLFCEDSQEHITNVAIIIHVFVILFT